jgi:hemoglobin/transferrin/lactoferrin receptor protein
MKLGSGFFRDVQWSLYTQASKTRQFTDEDRLAAADRLRDTTFDNRIWGASGQISGAFDTGPASHSWLAGADYSSTTQTSIRTGTVPPAGEFFPSRPFPNTDYDLAGVFIQDEIRLFGGSLLLYPAIRYDAYELTPERDTLYPANQPAAASDDSRVSPKFGVVAWASDHVGAFLNYASGYKAPSPSQVNSSFSNPLQNYISIANPDLAPESSDSIEAGVRVRDVSLFGAEWSGSATAFAADYRDFIEQILVSGALTPSNPGVFQFVNLTEVNVTGWEAKLDGRWDNGLGFTATAAFADGEQRNAGVQAPLQSIEPLKIVAGLTYRDPAGRFGGQAVATYVDRKDVQDVSSGQTTTLFLPPEFTLLDLTAYWNITDAFTLRVGAFNLTDETYWWWGDVRGLAAASTVRDAFTQPGRNYSASLTFRY